MDSYDVLIVGGGGAGLTAAIYASRARLKTILFERLVAGGQIALTDVVENYPGFPEAIAGGEISRRMEEQAKKYGTVVRNEEIHSLQKLSSGEFEAKTSSGVYCSRSVIAATGAASRTLGVPGEKELTGRGVSYCATCDGAFFKDKEIVVVGGGDSALQEGLFLTRFAKKLTLIHRRNQLRASAILQERAFQNPKIAVMWDTVVGRVNGKEKVEGVCLKHVKTGEEQNFSCDGIFVFIGHDPVTSYLKGFVELSKKGYVLADEQTRTSVPGVFAAGEVREGAVKQLVSACGEGCEAALQAQSYLEHLEWRL